MKLFKTILLVSMCLALSFPTLAQTTSTQGKEFWVSFMGNGFKTRYDAFSEIPQFTWLRIQLIVSAKRDCSCTIKNPNTGYSQTFAVEANNTYLFDDIPWEEAYMELEEHGQALNKGLVITADDTVSVYCANIAEMSFDASYVLPADALSNDYLIQTYDQSTGSSPYADFHTSAFLIVATEQGETTVDITPSVNTLDGHNANTEYSITLQQGQAYQVRSRNNNYGSQSRDLTGTRVTARDCKKIAVFNGNNLTMVPNGGNDSDCVFEQAMPLSSWGKKFVVTASLDRQFNDIVKITSAYDNNVILRNGAVLATLNTGESTSFELRQSDKSCYIESSHSCAVYLYNHSKDNDGWFQDGIGAPSMVWIAPIEQRINEITFSTFNYESEHDTDISKHYVNIIVGSEDIEQVYLDNELLPPTQFEAVNGSSDYSFLRKEVSHGVHHLTCANGINAHVYGFGYARGYAYMVGSNAIDLSTSVTINDISVKPDESFAYCTEENMTFLADVNAAAYSLQWDFGDGFTSNDNPATHVYHDKIVYPVTLTVNTDENSCSTTGTLTSNFIIDLTQQYITETDEVCMGDLYSDYGFNNVLINNDTLLARLVDNPEHPECKDSLLVYLTARPSYHIPIDDSRCWQGEPGIYNGYGFAFEYPNPGEYDRELSLPSVYGCDSVIYLHLTVDERITQEINHLECSGSFDWDGDTYTQSGTYEKQYISHGGCDSIVIMHLTIGNEKHLSFDTISCGVFHWDGQDYDLSGDYTQVYTTNEGCDSIVVCHLTVGETIEGATTTISGCDSYSWYGEEYTESGMYTKVFPTMLGCDSVIRLNLDLEYTPDPSPIFPADTNNLAPHWVVTATEFQIKAYQFTLWDNNPACHWDSVHWTLETPSAEWVLRPDTTTYPVGKVCNLYVLNITHDTVWIRATVFNECHPQGVERRYWLLCSFYDLEENHANAQFDIAPNPNNGEMSLLFEHFEGKTDVKVYDMKGTIIDHFQINNGSDSNTYHYKMKAIEDGIYFFVASGKSGVLTKKVVVIH